MSSNEEQESARSLLALIRTMTPTFEISSGGIKFTDNGVTAIIPATVPRQVISTKKIK